MRSLPRLLIFILAMLSLPSHANLENDLQSQSQVSDIARDLNNRIDQLPDPLFMEESDKRKVNRLLAEVLRVQNQQIAKFDQRLKAYRANSEPEQWFDVESSYVTLNSLNVSKQHLLEQSTARNRERLTGFGPYGVTQFKQEWELTKLNIEYLVYFQIRSFKALIKDILISPVPVIGAALKVLFIYFALSWWLTNSKRLIELFRVNRLEAKPSPPFLIRVITEGG